MASPRRACLLLVATAACGASARFNTVGTGRVVVAGSAAAVGPAADPNAGLPAAVPLPADHRDSTYRVTYQVWLPRAAEVDLTVRCGSAVQAAVIGETFEAYQTRRLAELRAMRAREQRTAAAVGQAVGQAVVGQAAATAQVVTPTAAGQATVAVDGGAAGAAVGASLVSTDVALADGDVGQGLRRGSALLLVPEANPGACVVELAPREPGLEGALAGTFEVRRKDDDAHWQAVRAQDAAVVVRADLRAQLVARGGDPGYRGRVAAEARAQELAIRADVAARADAAAAAEDARLAAQARQAVDVRLRVRAGLVARGADPTLRARLAAEASARAQAERDRDARLAFEARAQAQARVELALAARGRLQGRLVGYGADPGLRGRLAAQAAADRQRELALTAEANARLEAQLDAQEAIDRAAWEARQAAAEARAQLALGARAQLVAQLTGRGAGLRTPMPEPIDEMYGEPPMPGYVWASGHWAWQVGQWRWTPGYWQGTGAQGSGAVAVPTGGAVALPTGVSVGVQTPAAGVTITVGAGARTPAPRPQTQDHR
ncbi:MAG: YXWGXW repeat-containing protein [Kofleriaceae bacterium]